MPYRPNGPGCQQLWYWHRYLRLFSLSRRFWYTAWLILLIYHNVKNRLMLNFGKFNIWYTAYWCPRYYDVIMSSIASQITSIASRLFTQRFIHVQIKGNTKAPHHWSLYIYIYIYIYIYTDIHQYVRACVRVSVSVNMCVCVGGGGNIILRKAADALTSLYIMVDAHEVHLHEVYTNSSFGDFISLQQFLVILKQYNARDTFVTLVNDIFSNFETVNVCALHVQQSHAWFCIAVPIAEKYLGTGHRTIMFFYHIYRIYHQHF